MNELYFWETPFGCSVWGSGPKSISLLGNTLRDPT